MSHTHGKWKWTTGPTLDSILVPEGYVKGGPFILSPEDWGMDDETDEANAALIAAAPELYELACHVATHFEGTDAPLGIWASKLAMRVANKEIWT